MAWISSSPQPCDSGCSTCGSRSITDHDESCTSTLPRAQLPAESSSNCARPSPAVLAKEIRPERALTSRAQQDRPSAQPARDRRRALEIYVEQLADLLEKQTQNVASIAPFGELVKLQMEHDAWKLERDLRCADTKRRALATNEKPLRATPRKGSRMLEHAGGRKMFSQAAGRAAKGTPHRRGASARSRARALDPVSDRGVPADAPVGCVHTILSRKESVATGLSSRDPVAVPRILRRRDWPLCRRSSEPRRHRE
jgi:hypothetical protein